MCGTPAIGGGPAGAVPPTTLPGTPTGAVGGGGAPTSITDTLASLTKSISELQRAIQALNTGTPTAVAGVNGLAAGGQQSVAMVSAATLLASAGGEDNEFEGRVLALVNQERAKYGLSPVTYNAQLDTAARGHAAQMGATRTMAHDGIGDGDPGARARAAGFGGAWGENVAVGQTSAEQVVAEWMASPGHRANILNPNFNQLGVEVTTGSDGRQYWAQEFGS